MVEAEILILDFSVHWSILLSLDLQSTDIISLVFHIINQINFSMEFSNPFLDCYPPKGQDLTRQMCTESQIISTLNSSIEDLLSKILKVKQDYETSTQEEPQHNLPQFQVSNLKENHISMKKKGFKMNGSNSTKNDDKSTNEHRDFSSQNIEEPFANHRALTHHYPNSFETHTINIKDSDYPISNSNRPSSSKLFDQKVFHQPLLKINKIQSLFDSSAIKEVAESQVFSQDSTEGTYDRLQQNIRQVKQVMVQSIVKQDTHLGNISLSDFQMGNSVGSGKFGEVYVCRHKATGMIFALKKIFKSTIRQYKMQSQLCLELKILYMLNHPNIIKLYAHFCDQYHIFLLMEYVEGGQLLQRLKSNEKYVSRVIEQVINAVDYIHACGIVHRDIKPQNIVMAFDNTVKLCDFGWAGIVDYKSMKTTFCGTLDYVSPEMKDKGCYTSKVDLWSIGVLTFELLTGTAPFKDQINGWRKKGSKRNVPWDWHISYPSQVSGLSQSFMRNLLKQNPDERASLRFCKSHFFIRKHKQQESQINIQIYI